LAKELWVKNILKQLFLPIWLKNFETSKETRGMENTYTRNIFIIGDTQRGIHP
jgi:hypothetical protein